MPEETEVSTQPETVKCPNCSTGTGLEFIPMLGGAVYAQCRCGYGWDHVAQANRWVN